MLEAAAEAIASFAFLLYATYPHVFSFPVVVAAVVTFTVVLTCICGLIGSFISEHTQEPSKAGFAKNSGSQCDGGTDDRNATVSNRNLHIYRLSPA